MNAAIRGVVFSLLGVLVVWKLVRAGRSGEISSRGFTFTLESNPLWFTGGVVCCVFLVAFSIAEVLNAFGLVTDPVVMLQGYFKGS